MIAVVQRVTSAKVEVEGEMVGQVGPGLLVLASICKDDTADDLSWMTRKTTGLRNLPCRGYPQNIAWLELALTAADLLTWTQALCFTGDLARAEPATFRYRICAIAAKLTRTARVQTLHLDQHWPWAQHLANAFTRLRTAPWPG